MNKIVNALLLAALIALGSSTASFAAEKTVGVVLTADLPRYKEAYNAFNTALAKNGFGPGKATVYLQTPNPDSMSWVNSVRKFVGVEADVIVVFGGGAAKVAVKETDSIPVVYAFVYDPEACGFTKKNTTGVSSKVPMVTLLKTLKSVTPFSKLAVVYSPDEADSVVQYDEAVKNSSGLGYQVDKVQCKSASEAQSKGGKAAGPADAVLLTSCAAAGKAVSGIVAEANKSKTPVVGQSPGMAELGALVTLAPSAAEQGELAAEITAKILSGSSPSSIPMASSRKVDLVLNLKAAKALDMKVPFDVLNAATKVIK